MSGACVRLGKTVAGDCSNVDNIPQDCRSGWYFSRKEIENNSPSRKDGIDLRKEAQLRMLYCSFLQDVGMRLRVPQVTIATAIMLCHRFYLHQSHAKNEWQTIATVCIFLASKVEDTPCYLDKVVVVAYETMYQKDSAAAQRIQQKDIFEKQKALILIGERLLLCTVRFDFNIHHPYRPLHGAFKKFQITQKEVRQTAWNFVNDWLRTTLCLQYKPHYIAAGSLYLAAKHHNVKLTPGTGCTWWQELDITPHQLNAVVQQMMELLSYKRKTVVTAIAAEKPKLVQSPIATPSVEEALSSPDSCVLSDPGSAIRSPSHDVIRPMNSEVQSSNKCNLATSDLRDSEDPNGVVEDREGASKGTDQASTKLDDQVGGVLDKINVDRIRALMRARKRNIESIKPAETINDCSEDAWVERELEAGIELAAGSSQKKQKLFEGL